MTVRAGHWEWIGGEPVTFTNWRERAASTFKAWQGLCVFGSKARNGTQRTVGRENLTIMCAPGNSNWP